MAKQTERLTARQRACAHPQGAMRPTLVADYEQCGLCGLIRIAPIVAPWILEYDATAPEPETPELFPRRDEEAYIAESNAATSAKRTRRGKRPTKAAVEEPPAFYIAFDSAARVSWALGVLTDYTDGEQELGGSRYPSASDERDAWLWHTPAPAELANQPRPDYISVPTHAAASGAA